MGGGAAKAQFTPDVATCEASGWGVSGVQSKSRPLSLAPSFGAVAVNDPRQGVAYTAQGA
jgi:hypothetical protein